MAAVLIEKKDHIARITLNRPEVDNRINLQFTQEMEEICAAINQDDDIYVVLLTGAGEKFSCGSEIKSNVAASVAGIEKPVIAAINGDAIGDGLELALSCDIRIAANTAIFGLTQLESGTIPADGGTQRLPRLIGKGKALELMLTAETVTAAEALDIGLVSKVVPGAELTTEAEALVQGIATKAPISLRYVKEAVNKGMDMTMGQGLRLEADLYLLLHTTADRTEGITAFLEKRTPEFKGE
jgi:enoyl-CoA hydratase/carnithine racemase